jgi:hypothetical protein
MISVRHFWIAVPASNTPVPLSSVILLLYGSEIKVYEGRNINLLNFDLAKSVYADTFKGSHSPVIINVQNLQGPALHGVHGPLAVARTPFRIATWADMQAIVDAWRVLGWKRTTLATKEADKDVGTAEIATKRRVALCIIDVVIEIPYDMIQGFCTGMILVLYHFPKDFKQYLQIIGEVFLEHVMTAPPLSA